MKNKRILVNGVHLSYREEGTGDPIFLIHGLSSSKEIMYPMMNKLKHLYRIIAYDVRGHGESDKPTHFTLDDHASDLVALMNALNIKKAVLIGLSMGSYIAQTTAIKSPEKIQKMILMGSRGHGETTSVEQILLEKGLKPDNVSPIQLLKILNKRSFAPETSVFTKMKVIIYHSTVRMSDADNLAANQAIRRFNLMEGLAQLRCPTLVMSGEADGVNPPEYGREVAEVIPGAEFVLVPKAGHVLTIENAAFVYPKILEFLK
jgi:3-oxoadipate enol-lactonase